MPNLITHNYFGKKVKEGLSGKALEIINKAPEAFYLGAIGPDCLFALREIGSKYKYYPNRMQYTNTLEVFEKTADYLRDNPDDIKFAYMLGMICHYVADFHFHPYVNYFVERGFSKYLPANQQLSIHTLIESAIDSHICDEKLGIACNKFAAGAASSAPRKVRLSIGELYEKAINDIFGIYPTKRHISFSFWLTKKFLDISVDKKGRKKRFFDKVENIVGGKKKITGLMRPPEGYQKIDYMNRNHLPWLKVRNGKEYSTMSADELLEIASEKAVVYIENYLNYVFDKKPLKREDFAVNYEGVKIY